MTTLPFSHGFWAGHLPTVDREQFRGQHHYLLQPTEVELYAEMMQRLRGDDWQLLETLTEDDAFGALTFDIDGKTVSRDLLDSIDEISFLRQHLGWQRDQAVNVLDIGAGYGRLAHRLCAAMPRARVWCTDAITESSVICQRYLEYRHVARADVVSFDQVPAAIANIPFDIATAIHSWSECTPEAVDWWAQLLEQLCIPAVLYIGAYGGRTYDGRCDITETLRAHGFYLVQGRIGDIERFHFHLYRAA